MALIKYAMNENQNNISELSMLYPVFDA